MEKKMFQKIVKDRLKIEGLKIKGNNSYKLLGKDYLIGVMLDHDPYCRGYFIEYGVVYLPDESKFPFQGFCDWDDRFLFTKEVNGKLEQFQIDELEYDEETLTECFEYEDRTAEDLSNQLEINIQKKLAPLKDREFVLRYYSNNLLMLAVLPDRTIEKLLNLYNYDRTEINRLRRERGYSKFDF